MHEAGYFVTRNDRRWNVVVLSEIPVNELDVGATHSTRLNLDEHLIWLNVRNWHVLENEAFVVLPDSSCLHGCVLLCVCMWCSNAWSCQPWPSALAAERTDVQWLAPRLLRPPLNGVAIRDGPTRFDAEFLLRLERPVRLPEHFPGDEHQVGIPAGNYLAGLPGLGDQPHRARQDAGVGADPPGERHLVSLAHRDACLRHQGAGGDVDEVHAEVFQVPGQDHRLLDVPAA